MKPARGEPMTVCNSFRASRWSLHSTTILFTGLVFGTKWLNISALGQATRPWQCCSLASLEPEPRACPVVEGHWAVGLCPPTPFHIGLHVLIGTVRDD